MAKPCCERQLADDPGTSASRLPEIYRVDSKIGKWSSIGGFNISREPEQRGSNQFV